MQAPETGTTIVAVSFDGGVVLGADSRVSMGQYISNRASNKIAELAENIFLLRSGSAADCQAVSDYVRHFGTQYATELDRVPPVRAVANLVKLVNYNNKQLVGALIVAGWDKDRGGQIYGVPIGGTLVQEKWTTDGSGSTYLWGFLDSAYRDDLSQAEAEDLVSSAVSLAMARDGSSGGMIRLVSVTQDGVSRKEILGDGVALSWDERDVVGRTAMVVG